MIANRTNSLFQGGLFFRLSQRLPYVLVIVSAYLAAQLTWQAVAFWTPAADGRNLVFSPPTYQEEILPNSQWRWLNYVDMYKAPKPSNSPPSTDIKLNVQIYGLINNEQESFAMLKVDKEPAKLYGLKDSLPDGVVLDRIDSDSITLRKGGITRVIPLTTTKSDLWLEAAPIAPQPKEEPNSAKPGKKPRDSVEDVVVAQLSTDYQKEITQFKEKITKDPLGAIKDINVNQVKRDGTLLGWSIQYNINPALLRALGLLPTDVIIEVNGIPAAKLAESPAQIAGLMGLKEYRIVVQRDGALKTFNFKL